MGPWWGHRRRYDTAPLVGPLGQAIQSVGARRQVAARDVRAAPAVRVDFAAVVVVWSLEIEDDRKGRSFFKRIGELSIEGSSMLAT
jgi:hypothetical protein